MATYLNISGVSPNSGIYFDWFTCPSGSCIINSISVVNFSNTFGEFIIYATSGNVTGNSGDYFIIDQLYGRSRYSNVDGKILNSGNKLVLFTSITGMSFQANVKEF